MWPSPSAAATLRIVVANVALARLEPTIVAEAGREARAS